jgi:hypothetical protein
MWQKISGNRDGDCHGSQAEQPKNDCHHLLLRPTEEPKDRVHVVQEQPRLSVLQLELAMQQVDACLIYQVEV